MPKATTNGRLNDIFECYIQIGNRIIILNNLPDIGDSKSAEYQTENVIGRSTPLVTYSASSERVITMDLHFFIVQPNDIEDNLENLRLIQSAVYPREGLSGAPFTPPVVCRIKCGELLAKEPLCCILKSYSVKFPTEVAWATNNNTAMASKFTPFKFDVSTTWAVVYSSSQLPYNDRIINSGR